MGQKAVMKNAWRKALTLSLCASLFAALSACGVKGPPRAIGIPDEQAEARGQQ